MRQLQRQTRTSPLPEKGDTLLKPIDDMREGGLVDWGFKQGGARFGSWGRWSILAEGYRRAGDAVVMAALEAGGTDALVFPAVSLYRHYIELQLKRYLEQLREMGFTQEHRENNHDLNQHWRRLRRALTAFKPGLPSDAITSMERLVGEMHKCDPNSESFRFGEAKSGNDLLKCIHSVDMRNLRDVMGKIDNFFAALDGEIDDEQEVQQDLNQYLNPSE